MDWMVFLEIYLQKLSNAAEKAFAEHSLLLDDNRLLLMQNNEKVSRQSTRSTVIGATKVMSYGDIIEALKKRDANTASLWTQEVGTYNRSGEAVTSPRSGKG